MAADRGSQHARRRTIHRSKWAQQYVVLPNSIARDGTMSLRARGLLAYLLSLPPDSHIAAEAVADDNPEGRDAIRTAMRELANAGYLVTRKYQDEETGLWSSETEVFDVPQHKDPVRAREDTAPPAPENPFPAPPAETQEAAGGAAVAPAPENPFPAPPAETGETPDRAGNGFSGPLPKYRNLSTGSKDGSGELGPPAGPRGKPRSREQPTLKEIITITRTAVSEVYGDDKNRAVPDEVVLDLYGHFVGDRNPASPVKYLRKIFEDAPNLDTLTQLAVGSPEAADGLDAIQYGRCPDCRQPFTERLHPRPDGRCAWCER